MTYFLSSKIVYLDNSVHVQTTADGPSENEEQEGLYTTCTFHWNKGNLLISWFLMHYVSSKIIYFDFSVDDQTSADEPSEIQVFSNWKICRLPVRPVKVQLV